MSFASTDRALRLGLIVNPIAGMGGKVGLKGTDGPAMVAEARRRGAVPVAAARARRALARFGLAGRTLDLITGEGELGEAIIRDFGFVPQVVGGPPRATADDTRAMAAAMRDAGADLILFAGGDGTARDVYGVVGDRVPLLGIPTGVKMHSAVFATTPEKAGEVAGGFLGDGAPGARLREREIVDLGDEDRDGRSPRLYGCARVPYDRIRLQHAKSGAPIDDEQALDGLCRTTAETLEGGCVYIFGPGSTTKRIMRHAGIEGTLLGVDAVLDGRLVGADLAEREILALTEGRPARIVVSVIGGQGFLFGRGNQQISANVIGRVGRDRIMVVASLGKILKLDAGCLFVDTGDLEVDRAIAGYMRVETGPGQTMVCKVAV